MNFSKQAHAFLLCEFKNKRMNSKPLYFIAKSAL